MPLKMDGLKGRGWVPPPGLVLARACPERNQSGGDIAFPERSRRVPQRPKMAAALAAEEGFGWTRPSSPACRHSLSLCRSERSGIICIRK